MYASRRGQTDTVALLVDKGANIEATDNVRIPQHSTTSPIMISRLFLPSVGRWDCPGVCQSQW
jgi:hypothetical protein